MKFHFDPNQQFQNSNKEFKLRDLKVMKKKANLYFVNPMEREIS